MSSSASCARSCPGGGTSGKPILLQICVGGTVMLQLNNDRPDPSMLPIRERMQQADCHIGHDERREVRNVLRPCADLQHPRPHVPGKQSTAQQYCARFRILRCCSARLWSVGHGRALVRGACRACVCFASCSVRIPRGRPARSRVTQHTGTVMYAYVDVDRWTCSSRRVRRRTTSRRRYCTTRPALRQ